MAGTSHRTAAVNHPLKFNGYTFYQSGYNPNDPSWTSLEVVRDPGVPLVYGGFVSLICGLFIVFYLNPWLARGAVAAPVASLGKVRRLEMPAFRPPGETPGSTAGETPAATVEAHT